MNFESDRQCLEFGAALHVLERQQLSISFCHDVLADGEMNRTGVV